jgi:hypothetical protein
MRRSFKVRGELSLVAAKRMEKEVRGHLRRSVRRYFWKAWLS